MNNASRNHQEEADDRYRVGAVSFFNARPLIYGLDSHSRVLLQPKVPAQLGCDLNSGDIDVGLVPSIDYQTSRSDWLILPIAAIGSEGEVLTVRVFSQQPLDEIDCLACDTDSHTSVALARIIWHLRYGCSLAVKPIGDVKSESAILLIGDKVLGQLGRWPHELDLGAVWTRLTSLPFVYAFWAVPSGTNADVLVEILQRAYREGMANIDDIIERYAGQHGFDNEIARRYFADNLVFDFGARQRQGLTRFYELAYQLQLVPQQRPLRFCPSSLDDMFYIGG
ncbi:MAG: menaquinone biosynthesis protein [Sedimentisphaerales bacterium]|nr:menaquinone biosynthesis protein [Sedimentisphaerales bacterium]